MTLGEEIVLRPRFKLDLNEHNEAILSRFEATANNPENLVVSRVDNHVFIRIPKKEQHFWSPQLHLEIMSFDKEKAALSGLFGPNPTVWTMFMFFHFIIAVLFIGFSIWGYTNYKLDKDFFIQGTATVFMVLFWVVLYVAGRMGKTAGKVEMQKLHKFMEGILNNKSSKIN
jgi:hypothetical protein